REPDAPLAAAASRHAETEGQEVQLLPISAHDPEALKSLALRYAELLSSPMAPAFSALCRTAATRRTHHRHRLAAFGRTGNEVAAHLEAFVAGDSPPLLAEGDARTPPVRLAMVFSG